MKSKVREINNKFEYDESVNEFCGLIFHCPNCNEEFHIHVSNVWINNKFKSLTKEKLKEKK